MCGRPPGARRSRSVCRLTPIWATALKHIRGAAADPQNLWNAVVVECHHRGRLETAGAAVDDGVHLLAEPFLDLGRFIDGYVITGQQQCRAHDRLAHRFEQRLRDRVIGNADADGLAPRILQTTRHFAGGRQNESVRTGGQRTHQAIDLVINPRVNTDIGEVAANQGKIMILIDFTDQPDLLLRRLITQLAAQRIAGISGVNDHASLTHDRGGLVDQAHLRIVRVYAKQLAHVVFRISSVRVDTGLWYYSEPLVSAMKALIDFFPALVFFVAFYAFKSPDDPQRGILVATAIFIVVYTIQIGFLWFSKRRIERMHIITLLLVIVLGGATLLLQDDRFIKWKPTAVNWLFGLAFLGSQFIGEKNLVRRMLEANVSLPDAVWTRLNIGWVLFFLVLGVANLYVAFNFSTEIWVDFKLFGMMGLTLAFVVMQAVYLSRYVETAADGGDSG
jgi:intracellular septation protein